MTSQWPPIRVSRLRGEADDNYQRRRAEVVAIITGFRKGYFEVSLAADLDARLDDLLGGTAPDAGHDPHGVSAIVSRAQLAEVPTEIIACRMIAWPDPDEPRHVPMPRDPSSLAEIVSLFPQPMVPQPGVALEEDGYAFATKDARSR